MLDREKGDRNTSPEPSSRALCVTTGECPAYNRITTARDAIMTGAEMVDGTVLSAEASVASFVKDVELRRALIAQEALLAVIRSIATGSRCETTVHNKRYAKGYRDGHCPNADNIRNTWGVLKSTGVVSSLPSTEPEWE